MNFRKYMHIERFGMSEVQNIELGKCYIFPKLDGTNASVWCDEESNIRAGSRNRELTLENDNAGFYKAILEHKGVSQLLFEHPNLRLYGEWLVPHSLKTYRDEAWRRFYVFDVYDDATNKYLPYEEYKVHMDVHKIDYIPPIKIVSNASYDDFVFQLQNNVFMIEDGQGAGEGIVIKEYNFVNTRGNTVWAKIVTSEFKEKHTKAMGAPESNKKELVEKEIADMYVTQALCEKVLAKIENDGGMTSRKIPQLLNTVFYDVVNEEAWHFVKKFRQPTVNFKTLQHFVFAKTKEHLPTIF